HLELLRKRKVALRLGRLAEKTGTWRLKQGVQKRLIDSIGQPLELTDNDFTLDIGQKGVDMRIGLDIAAMSFKKQVDRIVLVAGDSDFVPAAKLARREGIDFILDPLWLKVSDDLLEHVDGLRSTSANPNRERAT
ncbi:MAG: NYN domain-containing protein, partial [Henriciella sp.]|nr:NYN domain-containing protein [Henriciella sp.]